MLREKLLNRGPGAQVEFGAIAKQQILRSVRTQAAHDGGTHEAPMAGYKDHSRAWYTLNPWRAMTESRRARSKSSATISFTRV